MSLQQVINFFKWHQGSLFIDHHNKYNNKKLWNIAWITKMWHGYTTWANAVWKVAPTEEELIRVSVWMSHFTVHLKLSQRCLLIVYTPGQNKKLKKKRKTTLILARFRITTYLQLIKTQYLPSAIKWSTIK